MKTILKYFETQSEPKGESKQSTKTVKKYQASFGIKSIAEHFCDGK